MADLVARLDDSRPSRARDRLIDQLLLLDSWWRTDLLCGAAVASSPPSSPGRPDCRPRGGPPRPGAGWSAVCRWALPEDAAERCWPAASVPATAADRIRRYARSHPLALHLAAAVDRSRPGLHVDPGPPVEVADELLRAMLAETEPRIVYAGGGPRRCSGAWTSRSSPHYSRVMPRRRGVSWPASRSSRRHRTGCACTTSCATAWPGRSRRAIRTAMTSCDGTRDGPPRGAGRPAGRAELADHRGPAVPGQPPSVRDAFFPHDDVRLAASTRRAPPTSRRCARSSLGAPRTR